MEKERHHFIYGLEDEKGNVLVPGALKNSVEWSKPTRYLMK